MELMQLENDFIKNRRLLVILLLLISSMVLLSVLQMFGYDFVPCFFDFYQETFFGLFMKKAGGTRLFHSNSGILSGSYTRAVPGTGYPQSKNKIPLTGE